MFGEKNNLLGCGDHRDRSCGVSIDVPAKKVGHMNNHKDRLLYTVSIITCVIAIALIALVTYWLTWPYKLQEHKTDKLQVLKKTVRPGDILPVSFDFTRLVDGSITVVRKLKNDTTTPLEPVIITDRRKGAYKFFSELTFVPIHTQPGEYSIEFSFICDVNPIRTVVERIETEKFMVVGKYLNDK